MIFLVCLRCSGGKQSMGENVLRGRITQLSRFFLIALLVNSIDAGKVGGGTPNPNRNREEIPKVELPYLLMLQIQTA